MMAVSDDDQYHAFDTVTDALMWSGWVTHYRHNGDRRNRHGSLRPFTADDVIMQLNKAVNQGKLTVDHARVAKYFIKQQRLPDHGDRDWLHDIWQEVIEVLEPLLKQKGYVYDKARI